VRDRDWVESFKRDWRSVDLEASEQAMLDYVEALTVSPPRPELAQVERLRELGFDDQAIFEINQIAGFFAWVNRTVAGLGVELEDFWSDEEPDNR
jgi:uncharacterized peroxidase-related enzyme